MCWATGINGSFPGRTHESGDDRLWLRGGSVVALFQLLLDDVDLIDELFVVVIGLGDHSDCNLYLFFQLLNGMLRLAAILGEFVFQLDVCDGVQAAVWHGRVLLERLAAIVWRWQLGYVRLDLTFDIPVRILLGRIARAEQVI